MPELTQRQREAIVAAYRKTGSERGASEATGHVWRTVSRVLAEAGLKGGAGPIGPESPAPGLDFDAILHSLRKRPLSLAEIANRAGMSQHEALKRINEERERGVNLHSINGAWSIEKDIHREPADILEVVSEPDGTYRLGACGDAHLCSKYARLDVLDDLYDQFASEGVTHAFNTGNWIDGEARFNKFDLLVHGMDAQVRYLAEHYPRRKGFDTFAVAGDDHEGWYAQATGTDIGRYAERAMREAGRTDWHDLGYMSAYVRLVHAKSGKSSMLHVLHPGGGSAYALSYTMQKIVESYAGGSKPAVLLAGHYHKMELVNVRNVWCVQTGCSQDTTPFMAKKRLEAHLGGHVIRLRQDERTGAIVEMNGMKRYFDAGYYTNNRWSHSGPVNLRPLTLGARA